MKIFKQKARGHRRRMETEAMVKVVASVWGTEFIQFLAALAILTRSIWKNRMKSTFFPNLAGQGIE